MPPHALVVDDGKSAQKIIEVVLTRLGYDVSTADDALAGLVVMRSTLHPLLVLLDDRLPPSNSVSLLAAGLADPWIGERHTFILMYTLLQTLPAPGPRAEAIIQALPRPPVLLRKPFRVTDIVAAVQRATNGLNNGGS